MTGRKQEAAEGLGRSTGHVLANQHRRFRGVEGVKAASGFMRLQLAGDTGGCSLGATCGGQRETAGRRARWAAVNAQWQD